MSAIHETAGLLRLLDDVRGTPQELATLLETAESNGPLWRERAAQGGRPAEDGDARSRLRGRLGELLAEAQRRIEDLLLQAEARPAARMEARAAEGAAAAGPAPLPEPRGSSAGAYLATSVLRRSEPGAEAP